MPEKTCYKLTDKDVRTYNDCQWELGEWKATHGAGNLCGPGWLHAYSDPLLAMLLNPIHANIQRPRLFKAEFGGAIKQDSGLKFGATLMRLIEEVELPQIKLEQRVRFAIRCSIEAGADDADWVAWALHYVDGSDRSGAASLAAAWAAEAAAWAAEVAEAAAWAARAAAEAAAWAAAQAAAWASARAAWTLDLPAIAHWAVYDMETKGNGEQHAP